MAQRLGCCGAGREPVLFSASKPCAFLSLSLSLSLSVSYLGASDARRCGMCHTRRRAGSVYSSAVQQSAREIWRQLGRMKGEGLAGRQSCCAAATCSHEAWQSSLPLVHSAVVVVMAMVREKLDEVNSTGNG